MGGSIREEFADGLDSWGEHGKEFRTGLTEKMKLLDISSEEIQIDANAKIDAKDKGTARDGLDVRARKRSQADLTKIVAMKDNPDESNRRRSVCIIVSQ